MKRTSTRPAGLWLAVHESAHAVAGLVTDELPPYPGPYLQSVSVRAGDGYLGICHKPKRVPTDYTPKPPDLSDDRRRNVIMNAQHDIIDTLAGPMAEVRFKYGIIHLALTRKRWIEEITGQTIPGEEDAGVIQQALRWWAPPDPVAEMKRLWAETEVLLQVEWPGIVAVARVLHERGEMDGDVFEEEWQKVRPNEQARERRQRRLSRANDGLINYRLSAARTRRAEE
jgi:hypothetical protein